MEKKWNGDVMIFNNHLRSIDWCVEVEQVNYALHNSSWNRSNNGFKVNFNVKTAAVFQLLTARYEIPVFQSQRKIKQIFIWKITELQNRWKPIKCYCIQFSFKIFQKLRKLQKLDRLNPKVCSFGFYRYQPNSQLNSKRLKEMSIENVLLFHSYFSFRLFAASQ